MFSRILTMNLKPNRIGDFTETLDKNVIPKLQLQKGFQDLITLASPNGTEVRVISLWERKENADAYSTDVYPQILASLSSMLEGTPQVKTYEVTSSTFHKIAAHAAV